MSTTRRDFLELIGVISAGFLIAPSVFANTTSGKKRQLLASSKDSVFFLTDILSGKTETFQVTAPGHDMYHHPFDSDLVLIVPKRTNKISVFSLSKKRKWRPSQVAMINMLSMATLHFIPKKIFSIQPK